MQSPEEKVPYLLERLQLSRFQIKEHRNFDDRQYRVPGLTNRTHSKAIQIIYRHQFTQDYLITHLELEFKNKQIFSQYFEVGEIQASKLTNRGIMSSVVRSTYHKSSQQTKNTQIPCNCITQTLQVSFLLNKQYLGHLGQALGLRKQKSKQSQQENINKLVKHTFKTINLCGYQLSMNTAASELIPLLNISQAFKHQNRLDQAAQTDILVSLSLISARRFVQAAETLKAASKFYVEKYISSKSSMQFTRIQKSWIKEDNKDNLESSAFSRTFTTGRVLEGGRYLYKAAKIQLLLADTINQPTLLGEKLQAFNRANSYANGNTSAPSIEARVDYESVSYNIGPSIIPFLVKVLTDKSQIFKISALKSIEFFYENLGCTLGNFMPLILKNLIGVYPSMKEGSTLRTQEWLVERTQANSRTKLLLDNFNHLLQSLLALLPGMNKKCLKVIFEQIIQVSLVQEYRNQLRLYLLRFGQRILQICGADLEISINYIKYIFSASQGKYSKQVESNKHVSHNIVHFSNRIIDLLKTKVLKQYNKLNSLSSIANWLNQQLISICQYETAATNSQLGYLLDLVIAIYVNSRGPLPCPIEPVIYILNTSLNQPKLPFQKVLQTLVVLIRYSSRFQAGSDLACQIIERILGRSKVCTLTPKQLTILEKVLEKTSEAKKQWLPEFLDCIPHSNFDEIYLIFDILVMRSVKLLDKQIILLIIQRLFDQYTVKGKAHQNSKEKFISTLIKELPGSLELFFQICLFQNQEPKHQSYFNKVSSNKEHGFDSKQYKLHNELFVDKINLLILVCSKQELILKQLCLFFSQQNIYKFYKSLKNSLENSQNFKVKSKILLLIKQFLLVIGQIDQKKYPLKVFLYKSLLEVLNSFASVLKDSKLQYYVLLNVGLIFQQISKMSILINKNQGSTHFLDQQISENFKIPDQIPLQNLIGHQLVKMWINLLPLLNSPLQNVRQMFSYVLLIAFKGGVTHLNVSIKEKVCQMLKPLLKSCLHSTDYSQRLLGIRLLALVIGLGTQSFKQNLARSIKPFKKLIEISASLEEDWNQEIASCSRMITNLCLSRQNKNMILKKLKSGKRNSNNFLESSNISFSLQEQLMFEKKAHSFDIPNSFDVLLKSQDQIQQQDIDEIPEFNEEWNQQIQEFRQQIQKIHFNAIDNIPERDSFVEQEQNYFDPNEQRHSQKEDDVNPSQQQQLEFEDLGIIELDDQQWGQQENQVKITQKLPLKKVYKLSPNLGSSTKHHRLRNQRIHHSDFIEDKLIVDQVEERIYSPLPQTVPGKVSIPPPNQTITEPEKKGWVFQESKKQEEVQIQRRVSLSDQTGMNEVKQLRKQKKGVKKRKSSTLK